jgi:hypothetical protein
VGIAGFLRLALDVAHIALCGLDNHRSKGLLLFVLRISLGILRLKFLHKGRDGLGRRGADTDRQKAAGKGQEGLTADHSWKLLLLARAYFSAGYYECAEMAASNWQKIAGLFANYSPQDEEEFSRGRAANRMIGC